MSEKYIFGSEEEKAARKSSGPADPTAPQPPADIAPPPAPNSNKT